MTQILDGTRTFTTDSGPSQPISVCDRGKGASQVLGESCQDTDETARGELWCHRREKPAEEAEAVKASLTKGQQNAAKHAGK